MTYSTIKRSDPEEPEKITRRRFTDPYKLHILSEVDACIHSSEIGAILKREGLDYSSVTTWWRQRQKGVLEELTLKKNGRAKHGISSMAKHGQELEYDNIKPAKNLS